MRIITEHKEITCNGALCHEHYLPGDPLAEKKHNTIILRDISKAQKVKIILPYSNGERVFEVYFFEFYPGVWNYGMKTCLFEGCYINDLPIRCNLYNMHFKSYYACVTNMIESIQKSHFTNSYLGKEMFEKIKNHFNPKTLFDGMF